MITMLKKSLLLRWTLAWLLISLLLTIVLQLAAAFLGTDSTFGDTATSQLVLILIISLPWFLAGELLSSLVLNWKRDSWLRRLGSLALLLLAVLLVVISLIFVGVIQFYFS